MITITCLILWIPVSVVPIGAKATPVQAEATIARHSSGASDRVRDTDYRTTRTPFIPRALWNRQKNG